LLEGNAPYSDEPGVLVRVEVIVRTHHLLMI
jgi:hypothetical protein